MKLLWLLSLFIPMSLTAQNSTQNHVDNLKALLKGRAIKRIELLRIPDEVMTRTAVDQEFVRSGAWYKVVFNKDFENTFDSLLSVTSPKTTRKNSDLRWGVIFYDASGQEVGSIFVDKFGKTGYLNKDAVSFGTDVAKRLRQVIRELH